MNEEKNVFTEETVSPETIEYPVEDYVPAAPETDPAGTIPESAEDPVSYPVEDIGEGKKTEEAAVRGSRKKRKFPWGKFLGITAGILLLGAAASYGYGVHY